ncbi:glycine betaine/L-proline ABC transporter ATP-binding protein [Kiritimatiellaeota bacterium B1221]|nr:glycine betaine/L-proline ABC transporter ATP-binding protein [Kiritimatiellaeota bacterium B1221]
MSLINIQGLYKVFGPDPDRVFPLLEKGLSKAEILDKTGCTIGINNACFEIERKEVFVIMGLSGSGKSTVIRCLNRLIEPTRGIIEIDGDDVMKMDKEALLACRRKTMSMVFQHFGLLPQRTVIRNVEYGLEVAGVDKETRRGKALTSLELVGLKGYEESFPSELSGGMQQRVGLARALASDPEILLMDEAFSALDPLIRANMQDELLELQATMHKTIVFITHDLDEALKIGDRIAIMKDGEVVQVGTPEEILSAPANDYVEAFVENVDKSKVITAASVMRKPQTITVPKDGPHVAVRAMERAGISSIFAVDKNRQFQGLLLIDDAVKLEREDAKDVCGALQTDLYVADPDTPVADLLSRAMTAKFPISILDDQQRLKGIVDRATVLGEVLGEGHEDTATVPLEAVLSESQQITVEEGDHE